MQFVHAINIYRADDIPYDAIYNACVTLCERLVLFLHQLILPRQRGEVAEVVFDKLGDRLWRSSREMPSPEEAKGHVAEVSGKK